MELATAKAIVKVIRLGHDAWHAWCVDGIAEPELKALESAVGATESLGGRKAAPDGAAQHLALSLAAFGQAYARCWAGARRVDASLLTRWLDAVERERVKDLQARLATADLSPFRPGERPDDGEGLADLMRSPLAGSAWRALWKTFSDPALTADGEAPPVETTPEAKREFERFYTLAWWEGLQSPGGARVRAFLDAARRDAAELVRLQLIADMANWDRRHVFGNLRTSTGPGPLLPLGRMYVEPLAIEDGDEADEARLILNHLHAWLDDDCGPFVVAAQADFGRGKSLTARRLVNQVAQRWLADAETPSPDLWRPVFVRCVDDITGPSQSLSSIVQAATKRHTQGLGLDCGLDHPACALPASTAGHRLLIVLDGLDEVVLGPAAVEGLFKRLKQHAGPRRRILVMSRPGALPGPKGRHGARSLTLQPFGEAQIDDWLDRWNTLAARDDAIIRKAIIERELGELAPTPVLLFMIARTWDETPEAGERTRAWLYEAFMRQVARGKYEHDRDHHRPVYEAAEAVRGRLVDEGLIDPKAEPEDAMLWLLARLAWRDRQKAWARRMENRFLPFGQAPRDPEPLTRRDVGQVLRDELKLDEGRAAAVEIGVVLTMQTDQTLGRDHVHFGHKSFAEFLAARFWADRLLKLARGRERDWPKHERELLGARLLMADDQTFALLEEILGGASSQAASPFAWTPRLRATLKEWAEDCFNDERQVLPSPERSAIQDDQRAVLREAALAIGSRIAWMDDTDGLRANRPQVFRSLLGWCWTAREGPRIIACKAQLPGVQGSSASYREVDFRQADLSESDFSGAIFHSGTFQGACARAARFDGANLAWLDLRQVDFEYASLGYARIDFAQCGETNFGGADLSFAEFNNADLSGADLSNTDVLFTDFTTVESDDRTIWSDGHSGEDNTLDLSPGE